MRKLLAVLVGILFVSNTLFLIILELQSSELSSAATVVTQTLLLYNFSPLFSKRQMIRSLRSRTSRTTKNNGDDDDLNMTSCENDETLGGDLKKRCSKESVKSDVTMEDTLSLTSDEADVIPEVSPDVPARKITTSFKDYAHQVSALSTAEEDIVVEEPIVRPSPPPSFFGGSPVIGVISQPRLNSETEETEYVIAASYVKWLEAAGARVLPIPWDSTEEMASDVFHNINGLLFIGGNSILPVAARVIWDMANQANAAGDFFPIWGTCLGFEYLLMLASGKEEFIMEGGYESHNVCLHVDLTDEPSEMYAKPIIKSIVTEQPVTMNNHEFGLSPETFAQNPGLSSTFRITSTNVDFKGQSFISTIESKNPTRYPYYGVQYHPEKIQFEYGTEPGTNTPFEMINHSADAVYFSFSLASFFVSLCRQNLVMGKHVYQDMERFPLVYKYQVGTGLKFLQYYLIPALGSHKAADGSTRFVGKDYSWRLDEYLAEHVGIFKEDEKPSDE